MASTSHRLVFFAFLIYCLLQAEGRVSLRSTNEDVASKSDNTVYFENKGNDVFREAETLDLPNSAPRDDETHHFPEAAIDNVPAHSDPKTGKVGQPNKNIVDVPWWSFLIMFIIELFHRQREESRNQFGVLYMANVDNLNDFHPYLYPHDSAGNPLINNSNAMSPAHLSDYGNYVCSRPVDVQGTMIHSEENMLQQIDTLWNAYRNRYSRTPNMILLYSWIMPCPDCTNLIINHFNRQPYANVQYRVVAHTTEGLRLRYMTRAGNQQSRQRLENNNITVYRQECYSNLTRDNEAFELDDTSDDENHNAISEEITNYETGKERNGDEKELQGAVVDGKVEFDPDSHTCKLDDSFQGCMVGCINADLCCSCKASGKKSMVIALVNQLTKDCAKSDIIDCAGKWVKKSLKPSQRGDASTCTRSDTVSSNVQKCASHCVGRPLSKPLYPWNPSFYPGYLKYFPDLYNPPSVDFTGYCQDIRTEGIFCTSYRSDSYTAGNTLCRSGNRCGYHGGTKYSWCYVSWSNHYDYCCTGSCGFGQGTSYEWCKSGNKWQYCGNAGNIDIQHRPCVKEYPCGVHQEIGKKDYYWCYVDLNKNWDRCCQPWHPCGKHGYNYYWCYTGYKRKTNWQYCKP